MIPEQTTCNNKVCISKKKCRRWKDGILNKTNNPVTFSGTKNHQCEHFKKYRV